MKSKKKNYLTLNYIRKTHYKNQNIKTKSFDIPVDINDWLKNPYTFLKSKYFIETSALIVFFAQFTKITPNNLTTLYIILGFLGGLFLASNNNYLIVLSSIIFFTKSSLDWGDGFLAKIKNQTSNLGHILDNWGAKVGTCSFLAGFGFYLYNKNNDEIFILLLFFIIFLKALDMKEYAYHLTMFNFLREKNKKKLLGELNFKTNFLFKKKSTNLLNIKNFFHGFIDDRSRTIDLIFLLILIDNFYYSITILKYIYYYIAFKALVIFCGGIYVTAYKKNIFKK
jgi:phosphatidylglycerophosphate synthase